MKIFVPSARQRWFLENGSQMVFGFGDVPDSHSARGLEIVMAVHDKIESVSVDEISQMKSLVEMKWDSWTLGGIETRVCQPNQTSLGNLIG